MLWALINEHGLNEGVLEMDEPSAAAHPVRAGWRLMAIGSDEALVLKFLGHAARHVPGRGWHRLPPDHVRAWNRARGHNFAQVLEQHDLHEMHVATLQACGMLDCLETCPDDVDLPAPPPRARRIPMPTLDLLPGLQLREMTEEEVPAMADELIAAKLYEEAPERTRVRVAAWYDDPNCWPVAVVWRGSPLSFETYHFVESQPTKIRVGFNVRLRPDRTHQFWRQAFRPLFEHLQTLGITAIESRVRADRPRYIDSLVTTYGAERLTGDASWVNLRYDIARAIANATGWPPRRTLGAAWRWTRPVAGGEHVNREALEEDLPLVHERLIPRIQNPKTRDTIARQVEEWFHLDAAALLLGYRNGELVGATMIRERTETVATHFQVAPPLPGESAYQPNPGPIAWMRAVGYTALQSFIPEAKLEAFQPLLQRYRARVLGRRESFGVQLVEIEVPLTPDAEVNP